MAYRSSKKEQNYSIFWNGLNLDSEIILCRRHDTCLIAHEYLLTCFKMTLKVILLSYQYIVCEGQDSIIFVLTSQ